MCLYIDGTREPLIAENDIVVYKFLGPGNNAPYYSKVYKANSEYKIKGTLTPDSDGVINEGFHAWRTESVARYMMAITADAHTPVRKVVKFIIPKGAKYFRGQSNDIVSDRIRTESLKEIR
jgi:hypothetical protein